MAQKMEMGPGAPRSRPGQKTSARIVCLWHGCHGCLFDDEHFLRSITLSNDWAFGLRGEGQCGSSFTLFFSCFVLTSMCTDDSEYQRSLGLYSVAAGCVSLFRRRFQLQPTTGCWHMLYFSFLFGYMPSNFRESLTPHRHHISGFSFCTRGRQ